MEYVCSNNTYRRKQNKKRNIESYAKRFVLTPLATERKTQRYEQLVQQTAGKSDAYTKAKDNELIFAVHLFKNTSCKAFAAVTDARYRTFCRKHPARFGKARNF